ncbi:MAG: DUF3592 domain-containing protein [Candidatus Saccharimonas sp.]|nr:DUF3592 domain-containing protein [Planctomycetaceae bacterium]
MSDRKSSMTNLAGTGCGILFLLPFAAVGIGAAYLMVWHISSCWAAQSWVERPCTILQVELKREGGGKGGPTSHVEATYQYEFANQLFTGNRVWFGGGSDNVGNFHQRVFDELNDHLVRGRPFRCFVDPNDPKSSVLYRDVRIEMLLFEALFAVLFGGVGVGGLCGVVYVIRKTRRMNDAREFRPTEPWTWDEATREGTFRPQPLWIGVVIFALIWNLVSWPMAAMFLWDELKRGPSLFWLFLAFPVIGLGAAWAALRAVHRRIRFGRPLLTIRPWPLFVGEPFGGTIDFPAERPASPELVVALTVVKKSNSKNDQDTTLFSAATSIPNVDSGSPFFLDSQADLPRSPLMNDEAGESTAQWQIKVTGSEGSRDFEAIYELTAFQRPAADSSAPSLVE